MSSSRKESERTKFIQEKCQSLLTLMLRDEDNKYCVDCDAKGKWPFIHLCTYSFVISSMCVTSSNQMKNNPKYVCVLIKN